jgi:diguanylate cyclase (GGDEF)-like protein/PAS domain S-box-containing protein
VLEPAKPSSFRGITEQPMPTVKDQIDEARLLHVAQVAPRSFLLFTLVGVVNWYVFHTESSMATSLNALLLVLFVFSCGVRLFAMRSVMEAAKQLAHNPSVTAVIYPKAQRLFTGASFCLGLIWGVWVFNFALLPIPAQATLYCTLIATLFVAVMTLSAFPLWHAAIAAPTMGAVLLFLILNQQLTTSVSAVLIVAMYSTMIYILSAHKTALLASIRNQIRARAINLQQERMFDSGRNAIVVVNRKEIVRITEQAKELLGIDEMGVLLDLRVGLGTKQPSWDRLWDRIEAHLQRTGLLSTVVRFNRPDGKKIWVEVQARLLDPISPEHGILWQLADATKRRELEERNLYLATHDSLTGCWNRAAIEQNLKDLAAQPVGERSTSGFSLLSLDLDGFKQINDQHGHAVGDAVLKIAKQRLENILRPSDMVGRLGGDEFIVLLPQTPLREQAALVSEKLVDAIAQTINVDGHVLTVGVSVGLAIWPTDSLDPEALMRIADVNMYTSKQAGRNAYRRALTGFI